MLKKVLALALAGAMVIGSMNLMAFAADTASNMVDASYDQQIAITGLANGDSVNFYQILEWDGTTNAQYAGWNLKAPFNGIVDANVPALKDAATAIKTIVGDPAGNPAVDFQLTAEIAGKLADLATTPVNAQPVVAANGKATLDITGDSMLGLYMALITPTEATTVYNPIFASADFNTDNTTSNFGAISTSTYSDEAAAKKSTITVTKEDAVDDSTPSTSYDDTPSATRIGEIVNYTITTTIPGYGTVYQKPHFVVKDKLTDLELNTGTVTLTAPENLRKGATTDTETTTGVDYIIQEETDGYKVIFTQEYLKTVKAPTTVTITYKATVTTDAAESVNTEENEVWVEYSHNPTDETDYEFKKDDTNHYTFTIDANVLGGGENGIGKSGSEIVKVGVDASGNPITSEQAAWWDAKSSIWQGPLGGALFTLYEDDGTTVYKDVDGNEYKDIPSLGDGRITLTGLDAGEYVLKETKAPNGYVKDPNPVRIKIEPIYDENKSVTMYTKDGENWVYADDLPTDPDELAKYKSCTYEMKVLKEYNVYINGEKTSTYTFYNDGGKSLEWIPKSSTEVPSSIVNTQGVELPSTGGIGTTLFYAGGAVLVLLAGVLLVSKRRIA